MSAQDQARALMNRHQHLVKNRQQAMLSRAAAEVGQAMDGAYTWNPIPGADAGAQANADRSAST